MILDRLTNWRPLRNWLSRHRNRTNFTMHTLGIPATVLAVPLAFLQHGILAIGFFVAGYALQFLGHIIEGNRSGEEELVRKLLRRRT